MREWLEFAGSLPVPGSCLPAGHLTTQDAGSGVGVRGVTSLATLACIRTIMKAQPQANEVTSHVTVGVRCLGAPEQALCSQAEGLGHAWAENLGGMPTNHRHLGSRAVASVGADIEHGHACPWLGEIGPPVGADLPFRLQVRGHGN